ncbi:hypothetical protein L1049_022964 [Liquidambar formosana]|uniref:Pentatricopeptide repeat-containing protein n=1 Tax=Liquidambar formosana TaxID=63359 RepID=A0AAP0RDA2_LIQFO
MGIFPFSRTCIVQLRNRVISRERCFVRVYYTASSALLLEDHVFDSSSNDEFDVVGECNVSRDSLKFHRKRMLYPLVVSVFKSLDWKVAREVRFSKAVKKYEFSHSIDAFRIVVHIFALAEMRMEVFSLLRDIVFYYNEANYDLFELFPTLLDSPNHAARSVVVFDVLIKVFAANSMLENARDVFAQAKKIGLKLDILSCNFLLKCFAEANRIEIRSLFEEIKKSGPSPNVFTYTIMMKYYFEEHLGQAEMNIKQATAMLEKMERSGESPTVVTYSTYIHGLCRVGYVENALNFIRKLRYRNQPLNGYCYNSVIYGFCQKDDLDKALSILEEMKSFGISPDVYSYSILIDRFCKNGVVQAACTLILEMEDRGIRPSLVTYSSLWNGLCKNDQKEISIAMFHNVESLGYKYDQTTYNIFINEFCLQGDMKNTYKLLKKMKNNNLVFNVFTFNSLIVGFCKMGLLDKALVLYNIMQESGVLPNTVTCNI